MTTLPEDLDFVEILRAHIEMVKSHENDGSLSVTGLDAGDYRWTRVYMGFVDDVVAAMVDSDDALLRDALSRMAAASMSWSAALGRKFVAEHFADETVAVNE